MHERQLRRGPPSPRRQHGAGDLLAGVISALVALPFAQPANLTWQQVPWLLALSPGQLAGGLLLYMASLKRIPAGQAALLACLSWSWARSGVAVRRREAGRSHPAGRCHRNRRGGGERVARFAESASMKRFVSIAALLIAAPLAAVAQSVASLADGRTGRIEFTSMTPWDRASSCVCGCAGDLLRHAGPPPPRAARMPAMVIAHGSGGILAGREDAWAARLNGLGIATFVVDSFTPRDHPRRRATRAGSHHGQPRRRLAALKLLATHPRIDTARSASWVFTWRPGCPLLEPGAGCGAV